MKPQSPQRRTLCSPEEFPLKDVTNQCNKVKRRYKETNNLECTEKIIKIKLILMMTFSVFSVV